MKTVLRNKARNIHRKLDIQEQREAAASNFDESIFDSLITEDSYVLDTMTSFSVKEHVFVVTPHIGKALSYLQPNTGIFYCYRTLLNGAIAKLQGI